MGPGWSAAVFLAMFASDAAAQATFRGLVRARGGGILPGAEVVLGPAGPAGRTSPDGRFSIDSIPAGTYLITVRAVGFQPLQADAEFRGRDTVEVTFELLRSAQVLESLRVEAPSASVLPKMADFEDRRRRGFGRFLTRADLAKREHSKLTDVLRIVGGVGLVRRPIECGDGFSPATARGMALKWEKWMTCGGGVPMPAACYLTIYQDGVRIWTWGQSEIPDLDQLFSVISIEGIEIYRGPSETPTRYQTTGSACGAVLLWTRD